MRRLWYLEDYVVGKFKSLFIETINLKIVKIKPTELQIYITTREKNIIIKRKLIIITKVTFLKSVIAEHYCLPNNIHFKLKKASWKANVHRNIVELAMRNVYINNKRLVAQYQKLILQKYCYKRTMT